MKPVGVIGAGRMGTPVIARLVAAGHDVLATDVRPERQREIEAAGAGWAADAVDVVAGREVVLTVLPGTPELRDLMLGPGKLLSEMTTNTLWIDLTSASPEFGENSAQQAHTYEVAYLSAPISGGPAGVRDGSVTLYVGGDAEVLDSADALLRTFAATIHHVGAPGAAYLVKLLANVLWFGHATLATEVLLLAQRHGQAPDRMREILVDGPGNSAFIERYLPALLDGDYLPTFGLDRCVEELEAVERSADHLGTPHPLTSVIADVHRAALRQYGRVDGELMAASWLEEQAGSRLRAAARRGQP